MMEDDEMTGLIGNHLVVVVLIVALYVLFVFSTS